MTAELIALIAGAGICALILRLVWRLSTAPLRHERGIESPKPLPAPPLPSHRQKPPVIWGDTRDQRKNYQHISDEAREARADAEQRRRDATPRPLVETVDGVTFTTRRHRGEL